MNTSATGLEAYKIFVAERIFWWIYATFLRTKNIVFFILTVSFEKHEEQYPQVPK